MNIEIDEKILKSVTDQAARDAAANFMRKFFDSGSDGYNAKAPSAGALLVQKAISEYAQTPEFAEYVVEVFMESVKPTVQETVKKMAERAAWNVLKDARVGQQKDE